VNTLVRKEKDQTLSEMLDDMKANTPITQTAEGGVARSLLEVFNERLDNTYDYADTGIAMAFLSTSSGSNLDKIGALLDCTRLTNESDTNYRYRISQQVYVAAKSNETALKLKCLTIPDVVDVIMTKYTYGIGSFTVHVISDELNTPDSLVAQVQSILDSNQAFGIRGVATKPKLVPIDVTIRLVMNSGVTSQESNSIAYTIKTKIEDYITSLSMGSSVESMKFYQIADQSRIADVSVESVVIDSKVISGSPTEYTCKWNERFYPGTIKIITG
jgi:hypothetical protein